jgi:Uma2 family endonuclease
MRFNYNCPRLPSDSHCGLLFQESCLAQVPDDRRRRVSVLLAADLLQRLDKLGTVLQAPCDVQLSHRDIVQPDILFIRKERYGIIGERSVHGSPDMIVEILSPVLCRKDLEAKRRLYSRFGVQEYWIVDPAKETIEVSAWCEIGYVQTGVYKKSGKLHSPLLPCVKFPLSEIFEN